MSTEAEYAVVPREPTDDMKLVGAKILRGSTESSAARMRAMAAELARSFARRDRAHEKLGSEENDPLKKHLFGAAADTAEIIAQGIEALPDPAPSPERETPEQREATIGAWLRQLRHDLGDDNSNWQMLSYCIAAIERGDHRALANPLTDVVKR